MALQLLHEVCEMLSGCALGAGALVLDFAARRLTDALARSFAQVP